MFKSDKMNLNLKQNRFIGVANKNVINYQLRWIIEICLFKTKLAVDCFCHRDTIIFFQIYYNNYNCIYHMLRIDCKFKCLNICRWLLLCSLYKHIHSNFFALPENKHWKKYVYYLCSLKEMSWGNCLKYFF